MQVGITRTMKKTVRLYSYIYKRGISWDMHEYNNSDKEDKVKMTRRTLNNLDYI